MLRGLLGIVASLALGAGGEAAGAPAPAQWPPASGPGTLFVHFGEEHVTDPDGKRIFPRVVAAAAAYRPRAVLTSADKANDGTVENLASWKSLMAPFDAAQIPYFAAVGNHDRKKKPGFPDGIDPTGDLTNYQQAYADRPYPFGDAPPPAAPDFSPRTRPADDPPGASSHYAFDLGRTRWIVLDNSCFSLVNCDPLQSPPFPDAAGNQGQLQFLAQQAADARAKGMTVLVQMHMPTQDPRPGHTQPTPQPHTMGEGTSPDNASLEQVAADSGVSGVFFGHIKGQWTYRSQGVPYFTDGGAGGAVYVGSSEKTGVDSGYWHGFRLVRVLPDGRLQTDAVPVFVPGGIAISAPGTVARGGVAELSATGRQPTQDGPEVQLALRPPARERPNFANLPTPAYVWTSGDPTVLEPLPAREDDPRDDRATQTQTGRFRAACPGRAPVTITSGVERASATVTVTSRPGPIVRSVGPRRRTLRTGRSRALAAVRLAQPARVRAVLSRGGRRVRTLAYLCRGRSPLAVRWDGRLAGRAAAPGRYRLEVRVLSDRAAVVRRYGVRLLGR